MSFLDLRILSNVTFVNSFFFGNGELVFHVFEEASEGVLGEPIIIILTMPHVEGGLDDALTNACGDAPRILKFFKFLESQCVDVLAILVVRRVDDQAANGGWNISREGASCEECSVLRCELHFFAEGGDGADAEDGPLQQHILLLEHVHQPLQRGIKKVLQLTKIKSVVLVQNRSNNWNNALFLAQFGLFGKASGGLDHANDAEVLADDGETAAEIVVLLRNCLKILHRC